MVALPGAGLEEVVGPLGIAKEAAGDAMEGCGSRVLDLEAVATSARPSTALAKAWPTPVWRATSSTTTSSTRTTAHP